MDKSFTKKIEKKKKVEKKAKKSIILNKIAQDTK